MQRQIEPGQRFYDFQVSANVMVVDPAPDGDASCPKCIVESSGSRYFARTHALEAPKEFGDKIDLMEKALNNKLAILNDYEYFKEPLIEMCDSATRDDLHKITPKNHYNSHPLWGMKMDFVNAAPTQIKLKYLLVHGFSPECILSQASIL